MSVKKPVRARRRPSSQSWGKWPNTWELIQMNTNRVYDIVLFEHPVVEKLLKILLINRLKFS